MVFVVCLVAYSWRSANLCCGYYANSFLRFFNPGCYRESGTLSYGYGSDRFVFKIILETIILIKQNFKFKDALKTALGMSFISMVSMEVAMNLTDYLLTGGAMLTWWVVPIMLTVGFLTPWPYNYWRLKKFGISCH